MFKLTDCGALRVLMCSARSTACGTERRALSVHAAVVPPPLNAPSPARLASLMCCGQACKRKRVPPACQPEHIVKALSTEGHEDEVRVGLLLLDAEERNPDALRGVDKVELLMDVMRQIGHSAHVIDGDALREMGEKEAAAVLDRPAVVVNLPSATFTSSSPNPYAGSSSSSAPPPLASPMASLTIAPLFPFPVQELHLPAATLHPLPETRLTTLMELVQNLHKAARQALASTCQDVYNSVCVGGLGFMANTGTRRELNVRVVEVNPRKDGLLPNEVFYVCTRPIRKHDEILAPYNNNESRKKQMRKQQQQQQQHKDNAVKPLAQDGEDDAEEDDDAHNDNCGDDVGGANDNAAEHGGGGRGGGVGDDDGGAAAVASLPGRSPRGTKLSKVQRARLRRVHAMEKKRKDRAQKRAHDDAHGDADANSDAADDVAAPAITAPQRDRRADFVDLSMDVDVDEDGREEEERNAAADGRRVDGRQRHAAAAPKARSLPELQLQFLSSASRSPSMSPSPSSSSTPSEAAFCSASPSPAPPSASPRLSAVALGRFARRAPVQSAAAEVKAEPDSAAAVGKERTSGAVLTGDSPVCGGFSVIARSDSPWAPAAILPQRTRAREVSTASASAPAQTHIILPFATAMHSKRCKVKNESAQPDQASGSTTEQY